VPWLKLYLGLAASDVFLRFRYARTKCTPALRFSKIAAFAVGLASYVQQDQFQVEYTPKGVVPQACATIHPPPVKAGDEKKSHPFGAALFVV
jgi:hypothetical protein